jgi:quercetin dioxygenase-like cupin family protein
MQNLKREGNITHLVNVGERQLFDVFGPTIQFFTAPDDADETLCVMRGDIPPGVCVPMHSHVGVECFFLVSGELEVLTELDGEFSWITTKPGSFIHVPSLAKHAFRNSSTAPAMSLISTTARLGRFFEEVGRPVRVHERLEAPTPEELQHFVEVAARYGYWLATPEENAAVGISHF